MIGQRVKGVYKEAAKERQKAGGKKAGRSRPKEKGVANLPPPINKAKARDQAAALVNVSPRSIAHAATVQEQGSPELIAAVDSGQVSTMRRITTC